MPRPGHASGRPTPGRVGPDRSHLHDHPGYLRGVPSDALHSGTPLPGYEAGASGVAEILRVTSTLPTLVAEYTGGTVESGVSAAQTIQALEAALASARLSTLFQGGMIGLVLGGSTAFFIGRNQRRAFEEVAEAEDEDEPDWEKEEGSEDE